MDVANENFTGYHPFTTQEWFSSEMQTHIQNGVKPGNVKVDLRISVLKPLHAKWVTILYDKMQSRQDIVKKKAGKGRLLRKLLWTSQNKILMKIRFYRLLFLLLMCYNGRDYLSFFFYLESEQGGGVTKICKIWY